MLQWTSLPESTLASAPSYFFSLRKERKKKPVTAENRDISQPITAFCSSICCFGARLIIKTESANCCSLFDLPGAAQVLSGPVWSCSPPLFLLFKYYKQIVSIMFLNQLPSYLRRCPLPQIADRQTLFTSLTSTCTGPESAMAPTLNDAMTRGPLPDGNGSRLGKWARSFALKACRWTLKLDSVFRWLMLKMKKKLQARVLKTKPVANKL